MYGIFFPCQPGNNFSIENNIENCVAEYLQITTRFLWLKVAIVKDVNDDHVLSKMKMMTTYCQRWKWWPCIANYTEAIIETQSCDPINLQCLVLIYFLVNLVTNTKLTEFTKWCI